MDTEVPRYTAVSEMCLPRVICFNLYQELFSAKQNQQKVQKWLLNLNKKDPTPGRSSSVILMMCAR